MGLVHCEIKYINRIVPAETQSLGFQITFSWSQVVKTGPTYIAQECISTTLWIKQPNSFYSAFSMARIARSVSHCSVIADLVLIHLSAVKDLSHCAVLTEIVRAIWTAFSRVGNAALNGVRSRKTSPTFSISAFARVRFARVDSMDSITHSQDCRL